MGKKCDYCGTKGCLINPPEFIFSGSCKLHDILYDKGGTESDRKHADKVFYNDMKKAASYFPIHKRIVYYSLAWIYYKAVRMFGKKYFNYHK